MKNKKWIVIGIVALVLVALIAGGLIWYFSKGAHFVWKFAHFNFEEQTCYIVDKTTGQIVDQTTLTMKGGYSDFGSDDRMLDVEFEIKGYTQGGSLVGSKNKDGWNVIYESDNETIYGIFNFEVGGARDLLVELRNVEIQADAYAICADSQEEALDIYRENCK